MHDLAIVSDVPAALVVGDLAGRRCRRHRPSGSPRSPPIVAGQLHAMALTTARGLDPDAPRNIHKVTRTR